MKILVIASLVCAAHFFFWFILKFTLIWSRFVGGSFLVHLICSTSDSEHELVCPRRITQCRHDVSWRIPLTTLAQKMFLIDWVYAAYSWLIRILTPSLSLSPSFFCLDWFRMNLRLHFSVFWSDRSMVFNVLIGSFCRDGSFGVYSSNMRRARCRSIVPWAWVWNRIT